MRKITLFLMILPIFLSAENLDNLLKKIEHEGILQKEYNRQKERKFLDEKNRQKEVLNELKAKVAKIKKQNAEYEKQIEKRQNELLKLSEELRVKSASLEELFGSAKQSAKDLYGGAKSSLLRAEYPLDREFLSLVKSTKLPNKDELEMLWMSYLKEIINASKVSSFDANVILKDGSEKKQRVDRVGTFTAFSKNGFLEFKDGLLLEYVKQPDSYLKYTKPLSKMSGMTSVAVDPTRGSLLKIQTLKPTISERLKQAGSVGYVIIALGIFGVILAMYQIVFLYAIDAKIKKQKSHIKTPQKDNPLGRVLLMLQHDKEPSTLENRLNQAIIKESSSISSVKAFIKLLAAVAPMLGLLGTVIGMIATFQAITLFGTGEPQLMAEGISQALITTVLGLIVAIPLLFLYAILNSKSQNIIKTIYEQSVGMMLQARA